MVADRRPDAISYTPSATVWALLLCSSALYFFSINEADNDLWGHVFFGRDILATGIVAPHDLYAYTAAGLRWVNHEWLSQALLAAVYQWSGSPGLLVLKLAIAAATFLLLLSVVRTRTTHAFVWGGVSLLSVAVLARGFAVRPQICTYLGVALTLTVLDRQQRGHRRALWMLPPVFVVWANLHGGFALGLAILALFAAARWITGSERALQPWLVLVVSTALTVLNPNGPRLLVYVWGELSRAHPITEWAPAAVSDTGQFVFFAMLGLLVVTVPLTTHWRARGWEVVLALAIGVLAVRHQRHTPVFALCAAAPLAAQVDAAARWLAQRSSVVLSRGSLRVIGLALVTLALLQLGLTALRWRRDGLQIIFDPAEYPTAAVSALRQAEVQANLAVPLDWGEYVLWFLAPRVKVSLDGRFATLFSEQVVDDNFDFFAGGAHWRRLLEEYPTEAALVPAGSACPVQSLPDWRLVFDSPVARVYGRVGSPAWPSLQRLAQASPKAGTVGIFP